MCFKYNIKYERENGMMLGRVRLVCNRKKLIQQICIILIFGSIIYNYFLDFESLRWTINTSQMVENATFNLQKQEKMMIFSEISSREIKNEETPTEPFTCNTIQVIKSFNICVFQKNDVVSNHVKTGGWETHLALLIFQFFQIYKNTILFDIGSNIGMHSMSGAISDSKAVWSLDAVREATLVLRQSSLKSNLQNKIRILNAGISSQRGLFSLWSEDKGNVGRSRLFDTQGEGSVIIPTFTLTDYLNYLVSFYDQRPQSIFIKMDIESMECKTILGSLSALNSSNYHIPVLVVEWIFNQFPKTECPLELEIQLKRELNRLDYIPFNLGTKKYLDVLIPWRFQLLDVVWFKRKPTEELRKTLKFISS